MSEMPPADSNLGAPPPPPPPAETQPSATASPRRRLPVVLGVLLVVSVAGLAVLAMLLASASGDRDDMEAERDDLAVELASTQGDLDDAAENAAELQTELETADAVATELQAEVDASLPVADDLEELHASVLEFLTATFAVDPTIDPSDAGCVAAALVGQSDSATVLQQYADVAAGTSQQTLLSFGLDLAQAADDCGVDLSAGFAEGVTYGDNPELDTLWDGCADGSAFACDELYDRSGFGTAYELFGGTCGERFPDLARSPFTCVGNM